MLSFRRLSRRAAMVCLGGGLAALAANRTAAVQSARPVANRSIPPLPAELTAIVEQPRYAFARWGIHVADRKTGEAIDDLRGNERFLAASTMACPHLGYGCDPPPWEMTQRLALPRHLH